MSGSAGLTARGRGLLGCGLAALVFARLFGTQDVALLGAALVAAVLVARVWVGLAGGPHVALRTLPPFAQAGERVRVAVELRPLEGAHSGRAAFREIGASTACPLRPVSDGGLRVLRGSYVLGPLERGLLELGAAELVREDPFGLARRVDPTRGATALTVVAPPLELPEVAHAGGRAAGVAWQGLRSGGHELHGVREHQPGESLRGVHWPATAHRGRLMVKELDDPGGDQLAVVLDARASADLGSPPDTSFELALAAAGALMAQAHADARRARLVVAGPDGTPAGASERAEVRRLLARARPGGERRPADLLGRLSAERIEVVTTRPADLIGAVSARRLGVVAIDPSDFDPAVARDAAALAALRAAGARVLELRRPAREPGGAERAGTGAALAWRGLLASIAGVLGLLYARDLQTPALPAPRLAAIALLAAAPALVAMRAGRRLGLLALAPAVLVASWLAADRWPSPGAPLGGLAGRLADAPSAWVQVLLPFAAAERPELRAAVLAALFVWVAALAWFSLARSRPLVAALLAVAPFLLSATVYELPQYPWRALLAGALFLAFLATGRSAGGGRAAAAGFAAVALACGVAVAAIPAASRPALLPWTTWTFSHSSTDSSGVELVWDMRYQPLSFGPKPVEVLQVRSSRPSYWRAVVLSDFDGLRFGLQPQGIVESRGRGGVVRVPGTRAGTPVRADVQVEAPVVDPYLVAPGQAVSYRLPPEAGAVDLTEDGSAQLRLAPSAGLEYVSEGVARDPSAQTLRALPARYPVSVAGGDLGFAGEVLPAFGTPGRERALAALFQSHRGNPLWDAWAAAYAKARGITRGATSPYQTVVALEAWLRTTRAYDERAGLSGRPDALARWAADGTAGYCQMFAASLAALARLSGVPARVAEGFAPGDLRNGVYHVTDRDAHAWVEAWFPGYGWLPFDATPGRDLPARASSSSALFDGAAAQGATAGGAVAGGSLKLPLTRLRAVLATGAAARSAGYRATWAPRVLLALAFLVVLVAALVGLERALLQVALPRDPARRARMRVRAFAADQGLALNPALTPREFAAAVEGRFAVEAGSFRAALERSAYAPGAGDEAGLAAATDGLLRAVRGSLSRTSRLRGLLSPRGVSAARGRAR